MKLSADTQRMIFGSALLIILAALSAAIALGHVEEKTSYGLMPLLTAISVLSGNFAQWAFSKRPGDKDDDKP